jgi:oxalate decarboxylase
MAPLDVLVREAAYAIDRCLPVSKRHAKWQSGFHKRSGKSLGSRRCLLGTQDSETRASSSLHLTMANSRNSIRCWSPTGWRTRPEDLALNFGVPVETFAKIPLHNLYIFQGQMPGPLATDAKQAQGDAGPMPIPSSFALNEVIPTKQTKGGSIKVADSSIFKASKTIAAGLVTIHPGAMREMHWHPNADEWQYFVAGTGDLTVFNTGPKVASNTFHAGDIGYVKKDFGHYIRNTGSTDLVYLEVFRSSYYAEVSLSDWLTHTPPALVAQHFNIDLAVIAQFPHNSPGVVSV